MNAMWIPSVRPSVCLSNAWIVYFVTKCASCEIAVFVGYDFSRIPRRTGAISNLCSIIIHVYPDCVGCHGTEVETRRVIYDSPGILTELTATYFWTLWSTCYSMMSWKVRWWSGREKLRPSWGSSYHYQPNCAVVMNCTTRL